MLKQISQQEIRRYQDSSDALMQDASEKIQASMRKFFTDYLNGVKAALADGELSATERITLGEAQVIARQFEDLAEEFGYTDLLEEYQQSFLPIADDALGYFETFFGEKRTFYGIDAGTIDALMQFKIDELDRSVNQKLIQPLKDQIIQTTIAQKPRREAVAQITNIINSEGILRRDGAQFTNANIEVLVSDSHRRFHREVRSEKAQALEMDILVYTGPNDKITRPACRHMVTYAPHGVAGFYYVDEFTTALHPELKEDPRIAGGGYNCRHDAWEVTEAYAISQGFVPRAAEEVREAA